MLNISCTASLVLGVIIISANLYSVPSKNSDHNIIPLVINGTTIDAPLTIANNFKNYFASIGTNYGKNHANS